LPEQLGLKTLFEPSTGELMVESVASVAVLLLTLINVVPYSIVAVHGIGANPDYTWTTSGINWLEHPSMLPEAVPKARIMRFGYDSQWFGENAIKQRLSTVAGGLLGALRAERNVGSCLRQ
jgi:hypothetical protein